MTFSIDYHGKSFFLLKTCRKCLKFAIRHTELQREEKHSLKFNDFLITN